MCVHATRHPLLPLHIIVTFDPSIESRSYIRVPLCVSPATGLPILNNRSFVPRPIYIYIYIFLLFLIFGSSPPRSCRIPSLSSYTIATKKTVHPSIVNIIIYLFFLFMYIYIYILFSSYKHVFLPIIYLQFARDVASRAVNSNLGGGIYRPPRYLSIYLSSFDSRFRLSFVFFRTGKKRKRNDERTASARDSRAEKRIRESINTEKRSQPRRFRCWREASGEGRGGTEDEREER